MLSLDDLEQRVAELKAQVDAIPAQSPQLNTLAQNDDVKLGNTGNPITNLDVLTYIAADNAWENRAAGAGSGFPVGPFDDTFATFEIQAGVTFAVGPLSIAHSMASSAIRDDASAGAFGVLATPASGESQLARLLTTSGGAALVESGVGLNGGGNGVQYVLYVTNDDGSAVAQLELASINGSISGAQLSADTASLQGTTSVVLDSPRVRITTPLPTSDPGIPGDLYEVAGAVKISL